MGNRNKHEANWGIDSLLEFASSLGIAGYAFIIICGSSGYAGAAAVTATLAGFGPAGMVGGIVSFAAATILLKGILKYGADELAAAVAKRLYAKGKTKEELLKDLEKLPLSKSKKDRIRESLESSF
jgi:rhodanese-related sulfurtransferase